MKLTYYLLTINVGNVLACHVVGHQKIVNAVLQPCCSTTRPIHNLYWRISAIGEPVRLLVFGGADENQNVHRIFAQRFTGLGGV